MGRGNKSCFITAGAVVLTLISAGLHARPDSTGDAKGQIHLRTGFEAGAGMGISLIRKGSGIGTEYSPRLLPHAGIAAIIPVEGRFSLKTGAMYEQKGWRATGTSTDSGNVKTEVSSTVKLHALSIPLAVRYTIPERQGLQYSFTLGISYSFFIQGTTDLNVSTYRNGQLLSESSTSWEPYIALIPDSDELLLTPDRTGYFTFNQAVRAEVALVYRKHYGVQLFGAYGINELSTAVNNAPNLKLSYCGLALQIVLLKKSRPVQAPASTEPIPEAPLP